MGGYIFGKHFDPMPDVMGPKGPMPPCVLIYESEGRPAKYGVLADNIHQQYIGSRYQQDQVC